MEESNIPSKTIPFFGKYKLRYDWEAYESMVEGLNAPAFADFSKVIEELGPKQIRVILWAGLLHMLPELTPKETYPIINEYLEKHTLRDLTEVVIKGLQEASILSKELGGSDQGEAQNQ